MKLKRSLLLLFLFGFSGCSQSDPSLQVLWQDVQARRELKAEKYEEALQSYYNLIEMNPYLAAPHSNIGVILNFVQRPEDALKSLEHALGVAKENKDLAAEFAVQFNLGVYYGTDKSPVKNIEKALEHYQAALDIVPSSVETKTNIELLVQQQQKQSGEGGENSQDSQQNQSGQSGNNQDNKNNKDNKDQKDQKDQKKDGSEDQKKDQNDKGDKEDEKPKDDGKKRESSPKYKPRPFKGEELSEGDVKKILGELRNQEQKIRANFEKKEKGKTKRNEKDW